MLSTEFGHRVLKVNCAWNYFGHGIPILINFTENIVSKIVSESSVWNNFLLCSSIHFSFASLKVGLSS